MTRFERDFYLGGICPAQHNLTCATLANSRYPGDTCKNNLCEAVRHTMCALITKELHILDWLADTTFGEPNATYEEFSLKMKEVERLVSALRTFEDSAGMGHIMIYGLDDKDKPIQVDWR